MKGGCALAVPRTHVEVDGTYVNVSGRLQPLVALLADGCSEIELRREVDAIKPGQAYDSGELSELIDRLFLPHNLALDSNSRDSAATWRLRAAGPRNGASGLESAIRCRVTVVPEVFANRVAQALKILYTPPGIIAAVLLCALIAGRYLSHFGLNSLSLNVLFRSVHEASALSLAVIVAAIAFASLFHEVGHCSAVAAYGSRVRRIGFGIYWLSPALFSDVSAAWTLTRRQRVAVDCGGIYFQVIACSLYALAATLAASTAVQLGLRIAIVANLVAVISALNPIMKCDGYWIISDAMAIPNLRRQSERAVRDLARNVFKRAGHQPAKEIASRRFLIGYGMFSLLFSAIMLLLFGFVIHRNAAAAFYFPKELWVFFANMFFANNGSAGSLPSQLSRLGLDFLKVLPVACAPIALLTATSALIGFLSRTFSNQGSEPGA